MQKAYGEAFLDIVYMSIFSTGNYMYTYMSIHVPCMGMYIHVHVYASVHVHVHAFLCGRGQATLHVSTCLKTPLQIHECV